MNPLDLLKTAFAGSIMMLLIMWAFMLAYFGFWLAALAHCIKHQHDKDRLMWILLIIFVPLFGAIFYFAFRKSTSVSPVAAAPPTMTASAVPPVAEPQKPAFDLRALHEEKQRAASINEALSEMSKRKGQQG